MLLNVLFLLLWRVLPPRLPALALRPRLALMTVVSLGAWGVAATAMVFLLQMLGGLGISDPTCGLAARATPLIEL